MISFQNLEVQPYTIEQLFDVHINHQVNEHSTLYFRGLLSDELKDSYVKDSSEGSNVSLLVRNSDGKKESLFEGMVQDVEVKVIQELYYIEVLAVSYSCLLDMEKKSRSFQDKKLSYTDLMHQVAESYENAAVDDVITGGRELGQLIVQYNETDWEFLKRLASHFYTGLIPDAHFGSQRLFSVCLIKAA